MKIFRGLEENLQIHREKNNRKVMRKQRSRSVTIQETDHSLTSRGFGLSKAWREFWTTPLFTSLPDSAPDFTIPYSMC